VSTDNHIVGLLLGTEEDWPAAFTEILRRTGPITDGAGRTHTFDVKRVTIEPFDLRDRPNHSLVIDRLAYWYYHPREWLKKVALMDGVYLLNSPFTFQSMEKHAAYCAMMRLGLKVPDTVLVPSKNPVDNARYAYTAARYNQPFDLDKIAEGVGYPMFMKPYDGGAWVGVSRVRNSAELHKAYDESGERLMHLQASVENFDAFARSLSIGAETMVMRFRPDEPMHDRYAVQHSFLSPEAGSEVTTISKLVNAFFRWEFNSCEMLVRGTEVHPIDYANACPDVSLTSLHYYFPWRCRRWPAGPFSAASPAGRPGWTWTRPATSPSPTGTTCPMRTSSPSTGSWPTATSKPSATPTSAPPAWRMWTRWCSTGCAPTSSTSCCWTPSARPTRPTSTTGSSRTSAA
jgi:hypothetical protein